MDLLSPLEYFGGGLTLVHLAIWAVDKIGRAQPAENILDSWTVYSLFKLPAKYLPLEIAEEPVFLCLLY